ncbi:hypothetical protein HYQ46_005732 [Verticillium longisporum]|nr:hypothetical protein HYQ46_005732 [Verticillium longisporum]
MTLGRERDSALVVLLAKEASNTSAVVILLLLPTAGGSISAGIGAGIVGSLPAVMAGLQGNWLFGLES